MRKIAVFTADGPRHHALISRLANTCSEVVAIVEYSARVAAPIRQSEILARYFVKVLAAETAVFGDQRRNVPDVEYLRLSYGTLNDEKQRILDCIADCDAVVVYGASYIRGALCDALIERAAVNLHVGVSPYYRGSACNFWALWDKRYDLVGSTLHRLSRGLDSGDIFFHALPAPAAYAPFEIGMAAVDAAQQALASALSKANPSQWKSEPQDKSLELRYSRIADFQEQHAGRFLAALPDPREIEHALRLRDLSQFCAPAI